MHALCRGLVGAACLSGQQDTPTRIWLSGPREKGIQMSVASFHTQALSCKVRLITLFCCILRLCCLLQLLAARELQIGELQALLDEASQASAQQQAADTAALAAQRAALAAAAAAEEARLKRELQVGSVRLTITHFVPCEEYAKSAKALSPIGAKLGCSCNTSMHLAGLWLALCRSAVCKQPLSTCWSQSRSPGTGPGRAQAVQQFMFCHSGIRL